MAREDHPMWRGPRHHFDSDHTSDHVHWVELFYDLIHVVTIFLLGNYLSHHSGPGGFVVFAGLFVAIWSAWSDSSVFASLYVSTDWVHRVTMALQICTAMFVAASIPNIPGAGWPIFAVAFGANRAITAFLYWRAIRVRAETTSLAYEMARNFGVLAIIFVISGFLPLPYGYLLFAAGIVSIQLLYMLPKVGVLRHERFRPRLGHIAERMALLVLIVLGEGFFKLVITLSEKGIYKAAPDVLINFVMGGLSIFLLCWTYFDFVGNAKVKVLSIGEMVRWWLAHLILMMGGVMIGVALAGEVKVGFLEPYPIEYGWLGGVGLAIFLLALMVIQNAVEPRLAHRYATWRLRLFGAVVSLVMVGVVPFVPSLVGNLLWFIAIGSQILMPLMWGYRDLVLKKAG
ncbi:MAG: low temperature requirement protein A [Geminicoccaceae bacterium]